MCRDFDSYGRCKKTPVCQSSTKDVWYIIISLLFACPSSCVLASLLLLITLLFLSLLLHFTLLIYLLRSLARNSGQLISLLGFPQIWVPSSCLSFPPKKCRQWCLHLSCINHLKSSGKRLHSLKKGLCIPSILWKQWSLVTGFGFFPFQLETEGCLSHVFSSNIFELNRIGYLRNLDVKAIVTEKGTGNLFSTVRNSISVVVKKESRRYSASACWVQSCLPEEDPFYKHCDHLQANVNSHEAIHKTKYIFSWLWMCLTGLQLTATQSISITRVMSSIQFENMDHHYRRGIPYFGQVSKGIESLHWRWLTGITWKYWWERFGCGRSPKASFFTYSALLVILNTEEYSFILSLILPEMFSIKTIH